MCETLIPTMHLRFVMRDKKVLQQQFYETNGRVKWVDVKLYVEDVATPHETARPNEQED